MCLSGRAASSTSSDLETARPSASSLDSMGILQESDLVFLDSPILMSKSVTADTLLGQSTLALNEMSLFKRSNFVTSGSSSILERSCHTRERNPSVAHALGEVSACSPSVLNLSKMSMLSMSASPSFLVPVPSLADSHTAALLGGSHLVSLQGNHVIFNNVIYSMKWKCDSRSKINLVIFLLV